MLISTIFPSSNSDVAFKKSIARTIYFTRRMLSWKIAQLGIHFRQMYAPREASVVRAGVILTTLLTMIPVFAQSPASAEDVFAFCAQADTVPEELKLFEHLPNVITAARKPQIITEAPSTIDVITAKDIEISGALTLTELLERLPGIYIPTSHNGLDMLWVRGIGGEQNDNALLLIDGFPYRTLLFSNFPMNEQLPLEDVERIEVIRGPGSALYGTNAFAAVINIITKNAVDIEKNKVSATVGSFDTHSYSLLFGKEFQDGEISLLSKSLDRDGHKAGTMDEGLPTFRTHEARNQLLNLKLRYKNLQISSRYSKFTANDPTQALDEGDEGGDDTYEHILTQLSMHHDIGEKLSLQYKAYFNYFDHIGDGIGVDPDDFSLLLLNKKETSSQIAGIDVISTLRLTDSNTLLFGINYERETLKRYEVLVAEPASAPFALSKWANPEGGDTPKSITHNNYGLYVQDEVELDDDLILTVGGRYDNTEASESRFSPRFSVVYLPDKKTAVKGRYGEAFRAPTYEELYTQTEDGENLGNTRLKPQIIKTSEIEISRFLADDHQLTIIAYHTKFENFIRVIGGSSFLNLPNRDFYGLELGVKGNISKELSYFANYSLTKAKESNGRNVDSVPENMGNLGVTYRGLSHVDIAPHLRLVGNRNRPANYQDDVDEEVRRNLLSGYAVVNVTLLFKNLPGPFKLSLSIRNVFDKKYHTPGDNTENFDVKQPGRSVLFTGAVQF